jgi:hypothetical protein
MNAEITWDLVMLDDMAFAEGCFRLEGGPWQVVTAQKSRDGWDPQVSTNLQWDSGVRGMNIILPRGEKLNKEILLLIMSATLGVERWTEVRGPDSMMLR